MLLVETQELGKIWKYLVSNAVFGLAILIDSVDDIVTHSAVFPKNVEIMNMSAGSNGGFNSHSCPT